MRSTITILLLSITFALLAMPVDQTRGLEAAQQFLQLRNQNTRIEQTISLGDRNQQTAYVYQLESPGFIIVPMDDLMPPVLAYSFKHSFENDPENPLIEMINTDISYRLAWFALQGVQTADPKWEELMSDTRPDRDFQQWPADGSTITDGWMLTRWNQSGVYNNMCPLDSGGERSVVGCVATAMSMLIYYHQHIGNVSFDQSDSYLSGWWDGIHIDGDHEENDFPSFEELNGYLDTLGEHIDAGMAWTDQDYAALNFAAGISVQMSYSSTGSGSWTELVADALPYKFGYSSASWMDWNGQLLSVLANEMMLARPTELSINTPDYDAGHAINCDGYNTDDFYHLNFGWGSSDSSCWYVLPEGMPSGYAIISGMAYNIEDDNAPVGISGTVSVEGGSPNGAYIRFESENYDFEAFIDNESGSYEIPAIFPGTYTAIATLGDRVHYDQFEVIIDENTSSIDFNLANYEALTGNITADVSTDGAGICLYQDGVLIEASYADENGAFSFPDILPGNYTLAASAGGGYFGTTDFTVTADDQDTDLELTLRDGTIGAGFSQAPDDIFSIGIDYSLRCGIKLDEEELSAFEGQALRGVRFKSPISSDEGEITAQIWMGNQLIAEKELAEFESGEWLDVELVPYALIDPTKVYYVGYDIHATSGDLAWHDAGPRLSGNGAFINSTTWTELATSQNFNFCIDAIITAVDYGTITGQITFDDTRSISDVVVHAGEYVAHADDTGFYSMHLPEGTYSVTAYYTDSDPVILEEVEVVAGETIGDVDFTIDAPQANDPQDMPQFVTELVGNHPNPFNPETRIDFSLATASQISLDVYNIKGQKIKTLANTHMNEGNHSLVWHGDNDAGKSMSSGIYFYRLQTPHQTFVRKMMLLK